MTTRPKNDKSASPYDESVERLSSGELAVLVIDALLRASIVKADDVERALRIATEEIEVRKALGDY